MSVKLYLLLVMVAVVISSWATGVVVSLSLKSFMYLPATGVVTAPNVISTLVVVLTSVVLLAGKIETSKGPVPIVKDHALEGMANELFCAASTNAPASTATWYAVPNSSLAGNVNVYSFPATVRAVTSAR